MHITNGQPNIYRGWGMGAFCEKQTKNMFAEKKMVCLKGKSERKYPGNK